MSFAWIPVTVGDEVDHDHLNEVQGNVNTLRSSLSLPAFSWTQLPKIIGEEIKEPEIDEARNALDGTLLGNMCTADNQQYDVSADNDHDTARDAGQNYTIDSNKDNIVYGVRDITQYTTNYGTRHNGRNGTVNTVA